MLLTHGALAVLRAASVSRQAGKTLDGLRSRGLAVQARASYNKAARDVARAIATTDAYAQSRKDRKKVEMLFAHLKRILKLDKLRLRGFSGAQDEFLLAATVQNLRRMAMWLIPRTPEVNLIPE